MVTLGGCHLLPSELFRRLNSRTISYRFHVNLFYYFTYIIVLLHIFNSYVISKYLKLSYYGLIVIITRLPKNTKVY